MQNGVCLGPFEVYTGKTLQVKRSLLRRLGIMGRLSVLGLLRLLKVNPLLTVFSAAQEAWPSGSPNWILREEERW